MIKKPIADQQLFDFLATLPHDQREVFILKDGAVRAVAIQGTHMLNQMRANFDLGVLETLVLGQAYLAGALLASTVKGNDRVQLAIECGGPIEGIYVEAWAVGAVRGYLKQVPLPVEKPLENFDLSPFFGPGFLTVTRLLEGKKQPFTGRIMLQHGDIAKDLAQYFLTSEQSPTTIVLSIHFDKQGHVVGAGGLFLQKMPGAEDSDLAEIEEIVSTLPSIGKYLSEKQDAKNFVETYFESVQPEYLAQEQLGFSCPCKRCNFAQFLSAMPEDEKADILAHGPFPLILSCLNCGSDYPFEREELESLLAPQE